MGAPTVIAMSCLERVEQALDFGREVSLANWDRLTKGAGFAEQHRQVVTEVGDRLSRSRLSFVTSDLNAPLVAELARGGWIERREVVLAVGPPGTGKSHCENHPAGLAWPTMLAMAAARMTRRSHWPVLGALALDMSPRSLSAPAWPPRVGLIRSLSASA